MHASGSGVQETVSGSPDQVGGEEKPLVDEKEMVLFIRYGL